MDTKHLSARKPQFVASFSWDCLASLCCDAGDFALLSQLGVESYHQIRRKSIHLCSCPWYLRYEDRNELHRSVVDVSTGSLSISKNWIETINDQYTRMVVYRPGLPILQPATNREQTAVGCFGDSCQLWRLLLTGVTINTRGLNLCD